MFNYKYLRVIDKYEFLELWLFLVYYQSMFSRFTEKAIQSISLA